MLTLLCPIRLLPLRYAGCDITSKNKVATNCSRSKIGFDAIIVFSQAHDRELWWSVGSKANGGKPERFRFVWKLPYFHGFWDQVIFFFSGPYDNLWAYFRYFYLFATSICKCWLIVWLITDGQSHTKLEHPETSSSVEKLVTQKLRYEKHENILINTELRPQLYYNKQIKLNWWGTKQPLSPV